MLQYIQDIEASGVVNSEKVRHILNTWYDDKVGLIGVTAFSIDVWKEAALRWQKNICRKQRNSRNTVLYNADPNCNHNIVSNPSGGIICTKCGGWFCY